MSPLFEIYSKHSSSVPSTAFARASTCWAVKAIASRCTPMLLIIFAALGTHPSNLEVADFRTVAVRDKVQYCQTARMSESGIRSLILSYRNLGLILF